MTTTPPDNSEWIDELRVQVTVPVEGVQTDGTQMVKNYTLPLTAEAKAQIIAKLREARIDELNKIRVVKEGLSWTAFVKVYADNRIKELQSNSPQGEEAGTV